MKEGGSIGRLPFLDGLNYSYWKAKTRTFLKAFDEKTWMAILTGWSHPTKMDDQSETVPNPKLEWSAREDKLAMSNSNALSTIFQYGGFKSIQLKST